MGIDYTIILLGCPLVVDETFRMIRLCLLIIHCFILTIFTLW
nr:MAG TPA: hypothetical protein [Caudoviricetes sp.]